MLKISASASYTNSTSVAHADTTGIATTITKSSTDTVTVPPMSSVEAELPIYPITYSATVSSTLRVDAPLDPYDCWSKAKQNLLFPVT